MAAIIDELKDPRSLHKSNLLLLFNLAAKYMIALPEDYQTCIREAILLAGEEHFSLEEKLQLAVDYALLTRDTNTVMAFLKEGLQEREELLEGGGGANIAPRLMILNRLGGRGLLSDEE